MTANGGPHVIHPVNREVEQVVHDFLSTQLELKGHRWSPRSNVPTASGAATTTGLDAPSRKRIKDALSHLTAELLAQAAPRLTSLIEDLEVPSPPSDLGYNSFKSIAVAILADGYGWNHVLTLMVFSSELAYQAGVTKGHPELVDNVSDWLTTYISQPDFLSWINSHDRWEGLIAYAAAQPDRNDQINGQWWGSRLLVGLGGALGVALTAGLILKL